MYFHSFYLFLLIIFKGQFNTICKNNYLESLMEIYSINTVNYKKKKTFYDIKAFHVPKWHSFLFN